MKLIIFAGGAGTRLWPISRNSTPKQFDKLFNGKSTIQLAVERVKDLWGIENVYISTNKKFKDIILDQLPDLPVNNLILEPERRDVAAAILLSFLRLNTDGYTGEVGILWADHLMDRVDSFQSSLKTAEVLIQKHPDKFVYFGERPRFANHNLGWINFGKEVCFENGQTVRAFLGWKYRPELKECEKMFRSNDWYWNTGYFITTIKFVLGLYKQFMPEMYKSLLKVFELYGTSKFDSELEKVYPILESISFDNAIVEKTKPSDALVLVNDFGWSDPGTLYALKEALEESNSANVAKGEVFNYQSEDCLVMNYEENKLVTTIGLKGYVVVNTDDALVVVHKDDVPKVKELVGELKKDDNLKRYT
ncbi:MAG: sugar phosphate nucleotidyltransferase [bacterium]